MASKIQPVRAIIVATALILFFLYYNVVQATPFAPGTEHGGVFDAYAINSATGMVSLPS